MSSTTKLGQEALQRKRGRPSGKNRTPLSLEERRARNAQYEKERRNETAEAFMQLAEAVGCDRNISNADLLATVISQIQRASELHSSDNIEELKRINDNLQAQILTLEGRLGHDDADLDIIDDEIENTHATTKQINDSDSNTDRDYYATEKHIKKRKRVTNIAQQRKRRKFNSIHCSDDSGIESQSPQPEGVPSAHTVQYITESQAFELEDRDTAEPAPTATQAEIYLSSELYQQLYPEPEENRTVNMEILARSLITIPSITPPQQIALADSYVQQNTEPPDVIGQLDTEPYGQQLMPLFNRELTKSQHHQSEKEPSAHCLLDEKATAQQIQPNLDFLTDNEKGMITEWILNGDFLENGSEPQMTGYAINYTPGYS